jgi:ankyrin repeat protein
MPSLSTLIPELVHLISGYLPLDSLCSLRATNRRFCDLLTPHYVSGLYSAREDSEEYIDPPLHNACKQGNLPLTLLLIRHGAHVSERAAYILYENDFETEIPEKGATPLHACTRGSDPEIAAEIARVLLQAGAEVNKVEQGSGQTPLHTATEHPKGMLPLVKLLLECGADINARDRCKQTPLHNCANCDYDGLEDGLTIAKLLLEAGAEEDPRSADGATPL